MARQRNPSGIPAKRILRPTHVYDEPELYARIENQADGFRRVRKSLLAVAVVVVVLAVLLVVIDKQDTAAGLAGLVLVPLGLALGGAHVGVLVTRSKKRSG